MLWQIIRDNRRIERQHLTNRHLASLKEGDRLVILPFAKQIQSLQARNLCFELVTNRFLALGKQIAESERIVKVLVFVGNQNINLGAHLAALSTCSWSGSIFKKTTAD